MWLLGKVPGGTLEQRFGDGRDILLPFPLHPQQLSGLLRCSRCSLLTWLNLWLLQREKQALPAFTTGAKHCCGGRRRRRDAAAPALCLQTRCGHCDANWSRSFTTLCPPFSPCRMRPGYIQQQAR